MTKEFIPACIFGNYKQIAEERYRRIVGQGKTCTVSNERIADLEYGLSDYPTGLFRVNWRKEDQPRIVEAVVDAIVAQMILED